MSVLKVKVATYFTLEYYEHYKLYSILLIKLSIDLIQNDMIYLFIYIDLIRIKCKSKNTGMLWFVFEKLHESKLKELVYSYNPYAHF